MVFLQGKTKEYTTPQVVINDILALCCSFDICNFNYACRACNKVDLTMAKISLNFEETLVWLEECPPDVLPLVLMDKSLIESQAYKFPVKKKLHFKSSSNPIQSSFYFLFSSPKRLNCKNILKELV